MSDKQRTIARPFEAHGHGLHTGDAVQATVHPAPENAGVRFRRVDLEGAPEIEASVDAVSGVRWETALGRGETVVRTVEHVMAAVHAMQVDNARIDLSGPEPPAMDGSAAPWCERLRDAGITEQAADARRLYVESPFHVEAEDARYAVLPDREYRVTGHIDFDHPAIGRQFASVAVEPARFATEIAPARTFGFTEWKDSLQARGFALGASAENTIVLSQEGLDPGCELRYPDEFVRHKILDIVGDLALVGARLHCHVVAQKPSHKGNVEVARRLRARLVGGDGVRLDIHDIMKYLPHRYPMLLVDRILEFEEGSRIVGIKNVTINEPFFQGHFPGHPIMPGVLVVEALAQCGGLLLMNAFDNPEEKVVYFMSLDDVKFRKPVIPGDQLRLELTMLQFRGRVCRMRGEARVDGRVVAEATMMAQVVDR